MNAYRNSRAGFSLVEVALALMVVGVGMVAIFSVLPAGMDANKRAIDDSQTALFAEEVFNGFRAQAEMVDWDKVPNITLQNPVPDMWKPGTPLAVTPGAVSTNIYQPDLGASSEIVDYALRYQLRVQTLPNERDVYSLRLLVWNGEFGSSGSLSEPALFYTEMRRTRR